MSKYRMFLFNTNEVAMRVRKQTQVYFLILMATMFLQMGCTTIHTAVREGNVIEVHNYLAKGADVNAKDKYGTPALLNATSKGNSEIVTLLIDKGADVNAKENNGRTALIFASSGGKTEIVTLLIDKGAEVNAKDNNGRTALMAAAYYKGDIGIVNQLIDKGADVNAKDNNGTTALIIAASRGNTEIVKLLLDKGADVNTKRINRKVTIVNGSAVNDTTDEETAISIAASKGYLDIIEMLQQAGAPPLTGEVKSMSLLPPFEHEITGSNTVQIRNPNNFSVVTGIRLVKTKENLTAPASEIKSAKKPKKSKTRSEGVNLTVPANDVKSVHVPNGQYNIYFVYSDRPDTLFQGDPFTLNNNGVEIKIVQVENGNYGIRQVK